MPLLADLTPLRESPAYRRMFIGYALASVGSQVTAVAVGLEIYEITGSTFNVGLMGLFAFVPLAVFGLYGGALVDAHDRRTVAVVTAVGMLVAAVGIVVQALLNLENVWLLYALVAVQSAFYAVNSPARTSIVPRLLPPHQYPAANALNGVVMGTGFLLGPLLAGFLVAGVGFTVTYLVEAVMLVIALTTLLSLPPIPPEGEVRRAGLASVLEGLRFLGTRPNVRMTFLLDLSAMVLAMPRVLFPALGAVHLGGGAQTVGILSAAFAVGSVLAGLFSGPLGQVRRQGLAVIVAVACWGLVVCCFGLVVLQAEPGPGGGAGPLLWPSVGVLAFAGVADQISAVFRMTILQSATPDNLRGRLQGVFIIVVAGGPRLGDLLLGSVAVAVGEPLTAVIGGLACILSVVLLSSIWRGFARYDAQHPTP